MCLNICRYASCWQLVIFFYLLVHIEIRLTSFSTCVSKQRNSKMDRQTIHINTTWQIFTLPPWAPLTAKQKMVDGCVLPSSLRDANAAAWPSIGWLTFLSTEYNCIAPTTRFCCKEKNNLNIKIVSALYHLLASNQLLYSLTKACLFYSFTKAWILQSLFWNFEYQIWFLETP